MSVPELKEVAHFVTIVIECLRRAERTSGSRATIWLVLLLCTACFAMYEFGHVILPQILDFIYRFAWLIGFVLGGTLMLVLLRAKKSVSTHLAWGS